jgi:hypothetical protein
VLAEDMTVVVGDLFSNVAMLKIKPNKKQIKEIKKNDKEKKRYN